MIRALILWRRHVKASGRNRVDSKSYEESGVGAAPGYQPPLSAETLCSVPEGGPLTPALLTFYNFNMCNQHQATSTASSFNYVLLIAKRHPVPSQWNLRHPGLASNIFDTAVSKKLETSDLREEYCSDTYKVVYNFGH
ncbi:unnamed protein product [Pieris brassicae]|uniref:Uncharacterized protein n=1 Tax=Pieris brassicae TaxID=7116 RepID=A0A9P0T0K4_PIEBR|nr:unnamed protein product [Pieris brassicae]